MAGGRACGRAVFVGGSVTMITRNCVYLVCRQTGSVCKGSDHLQLIKFWPSRAPGKGVCGGAKIVGSVLLQPARSVCVSLSAFFSLFICFYYLRRGIIVNVFVRLSMNRITKNCQRILMKRFCFLKFFLGGDGWPLIQAVDCRAPENTTARQLKDNFHCGT